MRRFSVIAFGAVSIFAATAAVAKPAAYNSTQNRDAAFLRIHGVTAPPHGFVEFCKRSPRDCMEGTRDEISRPQHADTIALVRRVNSEVNAAIAPATDLELYGVSEFWTIPVKRGDCEDYALLKRQRLIRAGVPSSALLMTVVLDEKGDGHAVLTVRTSEGDFILDNKTDTIKLWHETPYHFVMRQSYLSPKVWMSLDPAWAAPSVPVAGLDPSR